MSIASMEGIDPAKCPFCQLINTMDSNELCVEVSTEFLAFPAMHQRPQHQGHTLPVPRHHVASLDDLPSATGLVLLRSLKNAAAAVKLAFNASGVSIRLNDGPPGQSVAHTHVHIIPRYVNDSFDRQKSGKLPLPQRVDLAGRFSAAFRALTGGMADVA